MTHNVKLGYLGRPFTDIIFEGTFEECIAFCRTRTNDPYLEFYCTSLEEHEECAECTEIAEDEYEPSSECSEVHSEDIWEGGLDTEEQYIIQAS